MSGYTYQKYYQKIKINNLYKIEKENKLQMNQNNLFKKLNAYKIIKNNCYLKESK